MTTVRYRPTLGSSCAQAATAAEARFRIDYPTITARDTRIIALDEAATGIVGRLARLPWRAAHFLTYVAPMSGEGLDGLQVDARLRTADGSVTLLSDELTGADVAVMVATDDSGAQAASAIGLACAMRRIMTVGVVIAPPGVGDQAVSALRPHAAVLVVTSDEDDVPEMLNALRA